MNDTQKSGVSFAGLLTVAFITLKLIGAIQWSWLWVLAPIWLPFAVGIAAIGIGGILALAALVFVQYHMRDEE